ncbi:MAG: hypothetical protein R6U32_07330 [Candidatus Woesearchaeota archaeon]
MMIGVIQLSAILAFLGIVLIVLSFIFRSVLKILMIIGGLMIAAAAGLMIYFLVSFG